MTNNAQVLINTEPDGGINTRLSPTQIIFHKTTPTRRNRPSNDIHFQSLRTATQDNESDDEVLLKVVLFGYKRYVSMASVSRSAKQKYQKIIDELS
ncbi:hypothetical protein IL306_011066 [Fusarium sp. DS 682]|nr:hypothetical protein IL306_011066 [Fusarium sp. DS 682]